MIELREGDHIKLKKGYVIEASSTTEDKSYQLTVQFNDGFVLVVKSVEGSTVVCDALNVSASNIFAAKITVAYDMNNIDPEAIEILRPVEEPPELPPDPEPPVEEEDKLDTKYNSFSMAPMKNTTKRPEVSLYQGALKHLEMYNGELDDWYGAASAASVKAYQEKNGLSADEIIGKGTSTVLIREAVTAGFEPPLQDRIMSLIAYYEVSNRSDAYGMAENDIGDGAGANYGIMQCNSLGSVVSLLNMAGRPDLVSVYNSTNKSVVNPTIKDFFGSTDGIAAQNKYFQETITRIAMRELRAFGCFDAWETTPGMKKYWERAVLLWCDTVVQNGTMWSSSRKPFWKALEDWEKSDPNGYKWPELYYGTWWDEMLGNYIPYGADGETGFKKLWWDTFHSVGGTGYSIDSDANKAACKDANQLTAKKIVTEMCPNDPEAQLVVLAQMRSRSSSDKYWYQAVASRRITDATGSSTKHPSGVVNGAMINLVEDYYL